MSSKQERALLLENTPVFSKFSNKACQMLAPVFKEQELEDGEVLCREGDDGDYMAVVAQGGLIIEVTDENGDRTVVSRRAQCQTVGEMSCLDPLPRSATVRAQGRTKVLLLTRDMLDRLKASRPKLFSRVVRGIALRLAGMLDETNALISQLLRVKREPTQPKQPSLQQIQESTTRGRPVKTNLKLSSTGVLKGLNQTERDVLRVATEPRCFEPGEVICVEGEPGPEAYFVAEGKVDVLKHIDGKNYRLATTAIGGFLGQRALLREGRRSATLRAGPRGATLFCLSRDSFEGLLEAESPLAIGFQEAVTIAGIRQLRQANEMAAYLGAREEKGVFSRPISRRHKLEREAPSGSMEERLQQMVGQSLEENTDVEALASAYLETALQDWEVTPSELNRIQIIPVDEE